MPSMVPLSHRTKRRMRRLCQLMEEPTLSLWLEQDHVDWAECMAWLHTTHSTVGRHRGLLEAVRVSMLCDLHASFLETPADNNTKNRALSGWINRIRFHALVVAGALVAMCSGFNGIVAILGTFAAPMLAVVGAGILIAAVSFALFYHFERVDMSKRLGVGLKPSHQLLDVCLEEVQQIKCLRRAIDEQYVKARQDDELERLHAMIRMLHYRYDALNDLREHYRAKLNNPYVNAVKRGVAVMEGAIILASGFFAGKSLGLVIIASLGITASAAFWPIFIGSMVLSLSAFALYWYVERPKYQNRIGGLLGYDKDKIDAFTAPETVERQKRKLTVLEKNIVLLQQEEAQFEHGGIPAMAPPQPRFKESLAAHHGIMGFFKPPHPSFDLEMTTQVAQESVGLF